MKESFEVKLLKGRVIRSASCNCARRPILTESPTETGIPDLESSPENKSAETSFLPMAYGADPRPLGRDKRSPSFISCFGSIVWNAWLLAMSLGFEWQNCKSLLGEKPFFLVVGTAYSCSIRAFFICLSFL